MLRRHRLRRNRASGSRGTAQQERPRPTPGQVVPLPLGVRAGQSAAAGQGPDGPRRRGPGLRPARGRQDLLPGRPVVPLGLRRGMARPRRRARPGRLSGRRAEAVGAEPHPGLGPAQRQAARGRCPSWCSTGRSICCGPTMPSARRSPRRSRRRGYGRPAGRGDRLRHRALAVARLEGGRPQLRHAARPGAPPAGCDHAAGADRAHLLPPHRQRRGSRPARRQRPAGRHEPVHRHQRAAGEVPPRRGGQEQRPRRPAPY